MQRNTIEYFDGEDKLIGQLLYDEARTGRQPTVVLYPAFEGLSEFAIDYGERLVEQGFVVFAADIYGEGKTAETIEGCFALITPFLEDRVMVRRRSVCAFEAVLQQEMVDAANIGTMGFCFGGMCALELVRSGADVKVVAPVHAVLSKSDLPTEAMSASLLVLHGYKDPQVPPQMLEGFAEEMDAAGVQDWTFAFFGNAQHSFTDPKTGSFDIEKEKEMGREYNAVAARRTFDYVVGLFKERLV